MENQRKIKTPIFLAVTFAATLAFSQQPDYGKTTFPNSGKPAAQEVFLQGLLMLHSFQYEDARESFQEAQRIDRDFAMASTYLKSLSFFSPSPKRTSRVRK